MGHFGKLIRGRLGRYALYVLGLTALVGIVYWFVPWSLAIIALIGLGFTTNAVYRRYGSRRAGQVVIVGLLFIAGWLTYYQRAGDEELAMDIVSTPDKLEHGKVVKVAGDKWSDFYNFPPGKVVDIRAMRAEAQFAIQTQAGTYEFRPGQHPVVPGIIVRARVRALGPDPEEIWIQVR